MLSKGERELLVKEVEEEVEVLLRVDEEKLKEEGRERLVREGDLKEREIVKGIG